MKNIIILLALGLITAIFLGCFTVNTGENAIVSGKLKKEHYYANPGLYFMLPGLEHVDYIYMNNREAVVSLILDSESMGIYQIVNDNKESSSQTMKISLLVNWHVTTGGKYYKYLQKNGQLNFNKAINENISDRLLAKINGLDMQSLNQLNGIISSSINIAELGISLDQISIISVEPIYNISNTEEITAPSAVNNIIPNSNLEMQNKMIESAYYQAATIKTQAEIYQAEAYNHIKKANPKFYNYFRLIDVYKNSAKSKLDVPPFDRLYTSERF